jgi:uncharacterized protein YecE (DUF72 family)
MAHRNSRRLCLLDQGPAFNHPHAQAARRGSTAGELFSSGLLGLRKKLGPILWQFPLSLHFDPARFEAFIALLPADTADGLKLARRRHPRMFGRSRLAIDLPRPLRHAIEIHHESFLDDRFIAMLRAYKIALVIAETARKWPMPQDVTADFMYLRLHGDRELYSSGYGPAALTRWAERIAAWHAGKEPAHCPHGAVHACHEASPAPWKTPHTAEPCLARSTTRRSAVAISPPPSLS